MVIAQTAALAVEPDLLMKVPLNTSGLDTPQYKVIAEKLMSIKKANHPIKYIYTMTKTDTEGIWQFIVDPVPLTKEELEQGLTSYPGDKYDASRFSEMMEAFDGPAADTELEVDEWGVTLSGYAPICDKGGKAVAMLGVDIMAEDVYAIQKEVHRRGLFVLILGVIFSISLGMIISNRITNPVRKLVEGTRHIANGDLKHQVDISGSDEIGELAVAFNKMALSLAEARKKLLGYFYRVAQSLVRILEAKDHYTRGHSERVSQYAEKIAMRMGFPKEKVELIKEVVLLHDIGKIGIRESILNKNGSLTEEEWEVIRQHPVIGEDILKPVLSPMDMLAIVRGHHERYDGKGYPDGVSGENINTFAAIVSAADAYDAMTSGRSYKRAMSKEEAIEELKRNSGTQFNPIMVNTFIQILKEEEKG